MDSCCTIDFSRDAFQSRDSTGIDTSGLLAAIPPAIVHPAAGIRHRSDQSCTQGPTRQIVSTLAQILTPLLGNDACVAAMALIERFGSIAKLLDATPEAIRLALAGHEKQAETIIAARELSRVGLQELIWGEPVSVECRSLRAYLCAVLQSSCEERVHAIFLDDRGVYLRDEIVSRGHPDHAWLDVRRLAHRAFDLQAHGIILAHNHPSGLCEPSDHDEITTVRLRELLQTLSIELIDHLIVASGKLYSMRRRGLL